MNNELLIKMQHFFEVDLKIKKELYNNVPQDTYIDSNSTMKYADNLNDSLNYIFSEFKYITADFFGTKSPVFIKIDELERIIKNNFYSCGNDINKLQNFYRYFVSNMTPEFIDNIKNNCVGYTGGNVDPIMQATSINEILHFLHSYIINNEELLQAIPINKQKNNMYKYPITYRGYNSELFGQLFDQFPISIDCGWTDMVALSDKKLIMMVRDRGHALSIEISINNDIARLEYFIPKLCNIDMINALPGVNKVNENSIAATGVIETSVNNLPQTLYSFIEKVPTDADIVFEGKRTI